MTQQPLIPNKLPIPTDSDLHSDQDDNNNRKTTALPAIGLSKEQLKQRLMTLKDYPTYKQTKAKRINLETINEFQQTPVVSTAISYGGRQGRNEVLVDFIQTQSQPGTNPEELNVFQQMLKESSLQRPKVKHQKEPSFISYKSTEQEQKSKVKTMLSSSSTEKISLKQKSRCLTQPKKASQQNNRVISFPKELKNLKEKLKYLPIISQQAEQQHSLMPTRQQQKAELEDAITISIQSKEQRDRTACPTIASPQAKVGQAQKELSRSLDHRRKRQEYMTSIKTIIDKSGSLLGGNESLQQSNRKYSLASAEQDLLVTHNKTQIASVKQRSSKYWPSYPEYCISQQDLKKLSKLGEASMHIQESPALAEPVGQLDRIIKQQISLQHSMLNHELIHKDHSVSNRYDYLMELQRQNYKRNVKELLKCKKAYYLEKRRQQIRANGIKRMKKMGDRQVIKNKPAENLPEAES